MEKAGLVAKPFLTLTREYHAPPESVWRAWTDAKAVKQLNADPQMHEHVIRRPGTRKVRMKGREYKGYVYVDESQVRSARELRYWVGVCLDYNWKARASR